MNNPLLKVIKSGDLHELQKQYHELGIAVQKKPQKIFHQCVAVGTVEMAQWIYSMGGVRMTNVLINLCVRKGRIEMLRWWHSINPDNTKKSISIRLENHGSMPTETYEFAKELGIFSGSKKGQLLYGLESGSVAIVESIDVPSDISDIFRTQIQTALKIPKSNLVEILKWAHEKFGMKSDEIVDILRNTRVAPNIPLLEWIQETVADSNDLIRHLIFKDDIFTGEAVIEWVINHIPLTDENINQLFMFGCEYDADTLKVMMNKFFIPPDVAVRGFYSAIESGAIDCVKTVYHFLGESRDHIETGRDTIINAIGKNDRDELIEWLYSIDMIHVLEPHWTTILDLSLQSSSTDVVKWICTFRQDAVNWKKIEFRNFTSISLWIKIPYLRNRLTTENVHTFLKYGDAGNFNLFKKAVTFHMKWLRSVITSADQTEYALYKLQWLHDRNVPLSLSPEIRKTLSVSCPKIYKIVRILRFVQYVQTVCVKKRLSKCLSDAIVVDL